MQEASSQELISCARIDYDTIQQGQHIFELFAKRVLPNRDAEDLLYMTCEYSRLVEEILAKKLV